MASERRIVGWFVRRTPKQPPHHGQTIYAETRTLYPTEAAATAAMRTMALNHGRYTYAVAPAYMVVEVEEHGPGGKERGDGE